MAMADGYAMAGRRLGVVNLHISCGLGNAMGMLYNAHREGTPLLVTAGQQDRRLAASEPILAGDLVSVVRPWTKWAAEVDRLADLPAAVRRAIVLAQTPPTGPASSAAARLANETAGPIMAAAVGSGRASARHRAAADVLLAARRSAICWQPRRRRDRREPVAVAESRGAGRVVELPHSLGGWFSADHPQFAALPLWSPEISASTLQAAHLLRARASIPPSAWYTSTKTRIRSARTIRWPRAW
jgi:benzoylformate decarboxylase